MAKLYPFLFFFFILASRLAAQTPEDSLALRDTATVQQQPKDSSVTVLKHEREATKAVRDSLGSHSPDSPGAGLVGIYTDSARFSNSKPTSTVYPLTGMDLLRSNPHLNFLGKAVRISENKYVSRSYDGLFYLLVGMLFFFAIVKLAFGKYLGNLLTLFFRVSMRHQQIREQVLQSPFPSILLNILFVLSGGLYASFLLIYEHYAYPDQFWTFLAYASLVLTLIYVIKFIFLKVAGWIFNLQRTTETYLFIVFMTNKIIGIFLLPFLVILSFSGPLLSLICFTLSAVMIGIFYVYRIIASFKTLRKEIKISGLHFFLYLCAFEIAPLLLIYKVLLTNLGRAN